MGYVKREPHIHIAAQIQTIDNDFSNQAGCYLNIIVIIVIVIVIVIIVVIVEPQLPDPFNCMWSS